METDSSTLMHFLNLQKLAKEMIDLWLNYLHWLSGNYLLKHTPSSLRNLSEFSTGSIKRVFYGSESISFIGLKKWNDVSVEFKELCPLGLFKKVIKNESLMSLSTMKYLRSKLRSFVKYIIILANYFLIHFCIILSLWWLFLLWILDDFLYKNVVDIN